MKNPTYYKLGDHTETFQVDFDPTKTSYEKILAVYWSTHNHCAVSTSRQYMSAIFYANDKQKKISLDGRSEAMLKRKQRITTYVLPLGEFHLAEDYHQKYMLRQRPDLLKELTDMHPNEKDFLNSTAATRINAYLGGRGTSAQLQKEIDGFGLSTQGRNTLLGLVKRFGK